MNGPLPILNAKEAKFECTFGRGCEGICCREGRPPVYPEEATAIEGCLERVLPRMRPAARKVVERHHFLARRRFGHPVLRVAKGWCVFFNQGCTLHHLGEAEGDKFRYKPSLCSLFPLVQDSKDRWYVRQKGYKRERWQLFCLDPCNSTMPARESLREEIELARRFDDEQQQERVNANVSE